MKPLFLSLFISLALAGCAQTAIKNEAPGPGSQATGLAAQQQRITEDKVLADRKTIEALQQRLRKLNESGIPQNNYPLAKAQCWLDTAKTQYHENDRTGYIEESLTESQKIIAALEANKSANAGFDTPLVARSTRLRDDLWMELGKYKNNAATLSCNARTHGRLRRGAFGTCGSCRRANGLACCNTSRHDGRRWLAPCWRRSCKLRACCGGKCYSSGGRVRSRRASRSRSDQRNLCDLGRHSLQIRQIRS
jgi:outer membrane murein-binding lipoprotein Lpp